MTIKIPDDVLDAAGLSEKEILVEFACHLFNKGRLELWPAAQLAGMQRIDFEDELRKRKIPIYRPTPDELVEELKHLDSIEAGK